MRLALLCLCLATAPVGAQGRHTVRVSTALAAGATAADSLHAATGFTEGMASESFRDVSPARAGGEGALWVMNASVSTMGTQIMLAVRMLSVVSGTLVARETSMAGPAAVQDSARAMAVRLARKAAGQ